MSAQDTPSRQESPRSHRRAALVLDGLSRVARAAQVRRLYGSEHQQSSHAHVAALDGIRSMIAESGSMQIGIETDRLLLDGAHVEGNEATAWLTRTLVNADIAGLRMLRPPTPGELSEFLDVLHGGDRKGLCKWTGDDDSWLRLIAMSGSSLRFTCDGDGSKDLRARSDELWRDVVTSLLDNSSQANAMALGSLNVLQAVAASASADESRAVREALKRIADQRAQAGLEENPETLRQMLASLSPQSRVAMLSVASTTRPEWIETISDKLPVHDLAAAMAMLDRCGQTPPQATLMLMSKLVGLTELSSAVRHDLQHVQARWTGLEREADRHLSTPALTELLRSRNIDDYCPQDYREQLHKASTTQNAQMVSLLGLRDFEGTFTALRSCEVAGWLLEHASTAGVSNSGALGHLGARSALLLESNRTDVLAHAITAVQSTGGGPDREFAEIARRFKEELASPGIIDQVLTRAARADTGREEFLRHLSVAPVAMLEGLLARAENGRLSPAHPLLRAGIVGADEEAIREVLARCTGDTARRSVLVPLVLRHVPSDRIEGLCGPLLASPDSDLRTCALSALDAQLEVWSEPTLRAALSHADERVAGMGMRRIIRHPDSCSVETLTSFLKGSLSGEPPTGSVQLGAMQVLLRRGPEGSQALAGVLDRLNTGVSRNRIRACRAIAYELESVAARPEVARSLKRWRRSLAHTVGLFILDDERRRAA